jgi:hypothetical protein
MELKLEIEDELLMAARKLALERRTTLTQLIREHLNDLVDARGTHSDGGAGLNETFGLRTGHVIPWA